MNPASKQVHFRDARAAAHLFTDYSGRVATAADLRSAGTAAAPWQPRTSCRPLPSWPSESASCPAAYLCTMTSFERSPAYKHTPSVLRGCNSSRQHCWCEERHCRCPCEAWFGTVVPSRAPRRALTSIHTDKLRLGSRRPLRATARPPITKAVC